MSTRLNVHGARRNERKWATPQTSTTSVAPHYPGARIEPPAPLQTLRLRLRAVTQRSHSLIGDVRELGRHDGPGEGKLRNDQELELHDRVRVVDRTKVPHGAKVVHVALDH